MTDVLASPTVQRLLPRMRRRVRMEIGRQLCRYHAAPRLAIAVLILKDSDAATKIVVDTIVGAGRRPGLLHPGDRRVRTACQRRSTGVAWALWCCANGSACPAPYRPWPTPRRRCRAPGSTTVSARPWRWHCSADIT